MTICGVVRFLGVVGIGLVVGSTLRAGVDFFRIVGIVVFIWYNVVKIHPRKPPVFTLGVLDMLGCTCFPVWVIFLLFLVSFCLIFTRRVCWGRHYDHDWVEPWQ